MMARERVDNRPNRDKKSVLKGIVVLCREYRLASREDGGRSG